jgi:hypothetical protein
MSQLGGQSLSGKVCPDCSQSSFILEDSASNNGESGISVECVTYYCPNCGLKIRHLQQNETTRNLVSDIVKVEEVIVTEGK